MQHNHSSYKPLITILCFIMLGTLILPAINPYNYMQNFMGLFLIIFSYFKIINLNEFAQAFRQYDPLGKLLRPYSKLYPFVELALGLAFLTSLNLQLTGVITAIISGLGAFGIYQTIRNKQIIECACLGMVFKLPLSKVSLLENLVMCGMAIWLVVS